MPRGTSFAAAVVTGGLNLTRQRWESYYGNEHAVLASTWKAIAISAAGSEVESGPTCQSGWGEYRPENIDPEILAGDADLALGIHSRVKEVVVENGKTIQFPIVTGLSDFSVTVCWSDPQGQSINDTLDSTDSVLINDIDVRVTSESGVDFLPWRIAPDLSIEQAVNDRDNVEKVYVDSFDAGEIYTVTIEVSPGTILTDGNNNPASQTASIVIRNADAVEHPFKIINFSQTLSDEYMICWASSVGGLYEVESSPDLVTWSMVGGSEIQASRVVSTFEINIPVGSTERRFFGSAAHGNPG